VKILVLAAYIVLMLGVGFYSMKKTKTVGDFFLANRSLGPWVSAFAYGTTYFSAVLFIGYAGRIGWGFGLSSLWIVVGNTLLGSLLSWLILARRTRLLTEELQAMTMPEFLSARYEAPFLKSLSALIIFIFLVPYSASVYMGLSYLFDVVMGIPYEWALLLIAGLTGIYLVMGGYFAVSISDLIQGSVMVFGVIFLIFYLLVQPEVGGFSQAITRLREVDPGLVKAVGPPGFWPLFGLVVLTSLGPWGLPQMIQKFYALKNEQVILTATVVATLFALICTFGAYFTGSLTHLFFEEPPLINGVSDPELLVPNLIVQVMPSAFTLLFLLLIFSASMSTLSSLVLVSSSAIVIDLLPSRYQKHSLLLMRLFCVVFILCSLVIAFSRSTFIVNLMSISWGATAGSFLAPYLYGLFWKGANRAGATVSMLVGLGMSVILSWYYGFNSEVVPLIGSFSMLVPLLVLPIVSVLQTMAVQKLNVRKQPAALKD